MSAWVAGSSSSSSPRAETSEKDSFRVIASRRYHLPWTCSQRSLLLRPLSVDVQRDPPAFVTVVTQLDAHAADRLSLAARSHSDASSVTQRVRPSSDLAGDHPRVSGKSPRYRISGPFDYGASSHAAQSGESEQPAHTKTTIAAMGGCARRGAVELRASRQSLLASRMATWGENNASAVRRLMQRLSTGAQMLLLAACRRSRLSVVVVGQRSEE